MALHNLNPVSEHDSSVADKVAALERVHLAQETAAS